MAKFIVDAAMDACFSYVSARCEFMLLCSTNGTYAQMTGSQFLGSIICSGGNITQADGSTNGRAMSIAAFASVPVSVTGSILHVALVSSNALLFYTSSTAKAVTVGDAVNVPAFRDTIADPA